MKWMKFGLLFPDPQLKKRRVTTKRLTHPDFFKRYQSILTKNAPIHLKTDSQFLHGFTLGVIASAGHILEDSTNDLYNDHTKRETYGNQNSLRTNLFR